MSNQASVKVRVPIYDYARVIVAYLVILGHCLPSNDVLFLPYILTFHMPFFFLVSGMLYKEVGFFPWKKLCRTLLYPFIFFNILAIILSPILVKLGLIDIGSYVNADLPLDVIYKKYLSHIIMPFIQGKTMPNGPIWFLLALLWCKIMMYIINRNTLFLWLFILITIIFTQHKIFYYQIGSSLMVMPFFIVGYKFKLNLIDKIGNRLSLPAGITLLVISILLTKVNGRVSTVSMNYGHFVHPFNIIVFYLNAFIASYGTLLIFKQFKSKKIITLCANALISILCLQRFFFLIFRNLGNRDNVPLCFIVSILIFVVCVLLHYIIEKYIPIVIGKKKITTKSRIYKT